LNRKDARTRGRLIVMDLEKTGREIVLAAVRVHSALGPGLLESSYQICLAHELNEAGNDVVCELTLPVIYRGLTLDAGYKIDMFINGCVIVENKAVEKLLPVHEAQLLTYLKLKKCKLGYLLNWNVPVMKEGIKRMVLNL
jgi:GxxExxY protein